MLHWTEYAIESSLLGLFVLCACSVAVVFNHPQSSVRRAVTNARTRRAIVGLLMGLTAIAIIYSPWGQRSGAHLNPAVTLTYAVLGKVHAPDVAGYMAAHFIGAVAGVFVARRLWGSRIMHEAVQCAVTQPGWLGVRGAWLGEFVITAVLMTTVLYASNTPHLMAFTGLFAGALVATFILVEAPLSGSSMNPARTLGSALHARSFRGLWVYFTAPPLGMLCGAMTYSATRGINHVYCCKLAHPEGQPCIFRCHASELFELRGKSADTGAVNER